MESGIKDKFVEKVNLSIETSHSMMGSSSMDWDKDLGNLHFKMGNIFKGTGIRGNSWELEQYIQ